MVHTGDRLKPLLGASRSRRGAAASSDGELPEFAALSTRFFAWLIDASIVMLLVQTAGFLYVVAQGRSLGAVSLVVRIIASLVGEGRLLLIVEPLILGTAILLVFAAIIFIFGLFYYTAFEASYHQATPGKALLGLRVQGGSGERCSFSKVFERNVYKLFSFAFFGLGFLWPLMDQERRALHDVFSNTCVTAQPGLPLARAVPRGLFGAVVFALLIFYLGQAPSEATYRLVVGVHEDYSPLPPDQRPVRRQIAREQMLGAVETAGGRLELRSAYVRLRRVLNDAEAAAAATGARLLDIALFEKQLSRSDLAKLDTVWDLTRGAEEALGGRGAAILLQIPIQRDQKSCAADQFHSAQVRWQSAGSGRMQEFSPAEKHLKGEFYAACPELAPGFEFRAELRGEWFPGERLLNWALELLEPIREFQPQPGLSYSDFRSVQAVFNRSNGQLQVGFFAEELSPEQLLAIESNGQLTAGGVMPEALVSVLLPQDVRRVDLTKVEQGYTVELRGRSGLQPLTVEHPAGSTPQTLVGSIAAGGRLLGRVEGRRLQPVGLGIREVRWLLTFNAPVLEIGNSSKPATGR